MATIINNPPSSDNSMGLIVGIVFLIIVGGILYYYRFPILNWMGRGVQVNVPSDINVNVQQAK